MTQNAVVSPGRAWAGATPTKALTAMADEIKARILATCMANGSPCVSGGRIPMNAPVESEA
jgi:hypothetical protein